MTYYRNFYDSIISSNRSDIININYQFQTSLVNEKLGVDGQISLAYYADNNSEFSFDYFKNIPIIGNSFEEMQIIALELTLMYQLQMLF